MTAARTVSPDFVVCSHLLVHRPAPVGSRARIAATDPMYEMQNALLDMGRNFPPLFRRHGEPQRMTTPALRFDGPAYDPELDQKRLTGQMLRIVQFMAGEHWKTLSEIADATGEPEASVSAQLRHLRKDRFGKSEVLRRRRPGIPGEKGFHEYLVRFSDETRALLNTVKRSANDH